MKGLIERLRLRFTGSRIMDNCQHPNLVERRWIEDRTPMIFQYCPDCHFLDRGHVHGDIEGWADE